MPSLLAGNSSIELFLLPSGAANARPDQAVMSVADLVECFTCLAPDEVESYDFSANCICDWFMLLYDNELVSEELLEAIPIFMAEEMLDILVFFRIQYDTELVATYHIVPRVFRKRVPVIGLANIQFDSSLKAERVLNGWLREMD